MNRGSFLKRTGLVLGGLALGRLPAAEVAPVAELGIIRDSTLTSVNNYQMFAETFTASGGLCAPLSPIYDMPSFKENSIRPVRDVLPRFIASRGGIDL